MRKPRGAAGGHDHWRNSIEGRAFAQRTRHRESVEAKAQSPTFIRVSWCSTERGAAAAAFFDRFSPLALIVGVEASKWDRLRPSQTVFLTCSKIHFHAT